MSNKRQRNKQRSWCRQANAKAMFYGAVRHAAKTGYLTKDTIIPLLTGDHRDYRPYSTGILIPCLGRDDIRQTADNEIRITRRAIATRLPEDAAEFLDAQRFLGEIQDNVRARIELEMLGFKPRIRFPSFGLTSEDCDAIREARERMPNSMRSGPSMMGIPIVFDESIPDGEIHYEDRQTGEILGKIKAG